LSGVQGTGEKEYEGGGRMKLVTTCPNCDSYVEVKNGERTICCDNCKTSFTSFEHELKEMKEGDDGLYIY